MKIRNLKVADPLPRILPPDPATATSCCRSSDTAAKKRETAAKLSFKVGSISLTVAPLLLKIQLY